MRGCCEGNEAMAGKHKRLFNKALPKRKQTQSADIRGLLTQIHPALERVLGPRLDHPAVLDLLQ